MISGAVFALAASWAGVSTARPCRWASAIHARACTAIVIRLLAAIAPPRCNIFGYNKADVNPRSEEGRRALADLGGPPGPVGRPELALEDLARAGARQLVHEVHRP